MLLSIISHFALGPKPPFPTPPPPPKQGWSSPVMKETPRDNRPPKDFLLSLEGKSCLDLICVGTVEDAKVRAQ